MTRNKIIEAVGPKKYLDFTASVHNDVDYQMFLVMLGEEKTDTEIAALMGVSSPTVAKYRQLVEKEAGGKKKK